MKKLKTLLTLAMVALMSLSFTSCDEDANTAYYLDGTWRGNMYVNSSYDGVTYTSTYSVITFNAGYDSGNGYWVDYSAMVLMATAIMWQTISIGR